MFKRYFDRMEIQKRNQDRFFEMVKDQKQHRKYIIDNSTAKHDDPFQGPNGIRAQITRSQIARLKQAPVSLPKMKWER